MKYLENNRLKLRAPEPEDLEFLYETENNSELWNVGATVAPYSQFVLKEYLRNAGRDIFEAKELRLMIDEKSSGNTIGMIDLFDFDPLHRRAGVGIMLTETKRKQGYASDALELLINYSFNLLKLKQLYCNIISEQKDSIRLFESKAFTKTGFKKAWINDPDGFKDVLFFQLINDKE